MGVLLAGDPEPSWSFFRKAMADLGYVEGRTVAFDYRAAGVNNAELDRMAAALVSRKVDVIVAVLSQAIEAAKRATTTIPIVFFGAAPEIGSVASIARPEANLTGVFNPSSSVAGKGLQLFKEIKPATKSVGLLLNDADPFHVPLQRAVEAAGRAEGLATPAALIKTRPELEQAFAAMKADGVDAVFTQPSLGFEASAALQLQYRLPLFSFRRELPDVGGLFSYGANQADNMRQVADYAARVLKGARPADLPLQQASRFELVANQKTARTLGIVLPPLFLARCDEVIE
ncbi:MAG: ABC transporter substrate-binding protein [Alphaproteobacteria bacterium]|nr:ABC transporter substrate-binding protein [Alphaproteobacteria bacterium]